MILFLMMKSEMYMLVAHILLMIVTNACKTDGDCNSFTQFCCKGFCDFTSSCSKCHADSDC